MKPLSFRARSRASSFTLALALHLLVAVASIFVPRCANAAETDVRVAAGLYTPTRTEDGLHWDARWILSADVAATVKDDDTLVIRFARPLPEGETLWLDVPFSGVPAVRGVFESGRMVAVRVPGTLVDARTVHATFVQRVAEHAQHFVLGAPVAQGNAVQIIDGELAPDTRLDVDAKRFERHVGHVSAPGVDHNARVEARRLTRYDAGVSGSAVFLRGDDLRDRGDIEAAVVTSRERAHHGFVGIAVLFGVLVAGLLAALRKLRHAAGVERADAVLAAEIGRAGETR